MPNKWGKEGGKKELWKGGGKRRGRERRKFEEKILSFSFKVLPIF